MKLLGLICGLLLIGVLPAGAQGDTPPVPGQGDTPVVRDITYNEVVQETITNDAFYDWWALDASAGDQIHIEMIASDGLVPLLGLLDVGGTLVARSDSNGVASVNGTATIDYTIPADGQYRIVPTRDGNEKGTSTGSYTLVVHNTNNQDRPNPYAEVTFRCHESEAANVFQLEFTEDSISPSNFVVTVYGLDGFQPVIRVHVETGDTTACLQGAGSTVGDVVNVPGIDSFTVDEQQSAFTAQTSITGGNAGLITLTIGSAGSAPGRYVAVIRGLQILPGGDTDLMTARLGPLAQEQPALFYMIAAPNVRLDPYLRWSISDTDTVTCDDAGRRGCEEVPSIAGLGVTQMRDTEIAIVGDRFDAGLNLDPGSSDPMTLIMSSRSTDVTGPYALLIIGDLPSPDASGG